MPILAWALPLLKVTTKTSRGDPGRVKKKILVLDTDEKQRRELCSVIERLSYNAIPRNSRINLERLDQEEAFQAIIVDLDTVQVDNRFLRELKRRNPDIYIIALSRRQFHPELEESIGNYIYACLMKPLDPDELLFWLKSMFENDTGTKYVPA